MDVVCEAQFFRFLVVRIREDGFHFYIFVRFVRVKRLILESRLVANEIMDERFQTAVEIKAVVERMFVAVIHETDADAFREIALLAQMVQDFFAVVLDFLENYRIGIKDDFRAGMLRSADFFHVELRLAPLILLGIDRAVPVNLDFQPFGERVHDRDTHAVQAARNFV